ncbi:hypothetical protein HYU12_05410, partial [Candidatus Woesearchaeota archaeon]|nr:hypothetical protein [Candidatus Woesearchaeota archaeon]
HLQNRGEIIEKGDGKLTYTGTGRAKPDSIDRNTILFNLSHYGYDLRTTQKISGKEILPLEELLIQILLRYPEARFIEATPTLMLKNKVNKFELYRKAHDYNLINKIGFLTEIACILARKKRKKNRDFEELLNVLRSKKKKSISYLSTSTDKAFLERTTPEIMRKWNLRGRFSLSDFHKEEYL